MGRRMTFPFALEDCNGPRDVTKHNYHVRKCSKNFSRPPQIQTTHSSSILFLMTLGSKWVSKLKNDHRLAFVTIKTEWWVARPPQLLCEIPMDPSMFAKTNYACKSTLEKFLRPFEATRLLPKRALFAPF